MSFKTLASGVGGVCVLLSVFASILSFITQQIFLKVAEDSGVDSVELSGGIQTLIHLLDLRKSALII